MDYTGSIYRLIDRAEDEMKEYAQRVKQLSADEIYRHSAETAAKESLLSALIHDSYELDDDDLDLILKPKNPVEALYQFLTSDKTDLSSESSISSILSEYNAQCQERDLTLSRSPGKLGTGQLDGRLCSHPLRSQRCGAGDQSILWNG